MDDGSGRARGVPAAKPGADGRERPRAGGTVRPLAGHRVVGASPPRERAQGASNCLCLLFPRERAQGASNCLCLLFDVVLVVVVDGVAVVVLCFPHDSPRSYVLTIVIVRNYAGWLEWLECVCLGGGAQATGPGDLDTAHPYAWVIDFRWDHMVKNFSSCVFAHKNGLDMTDFRGTDADLMKVNHYIYE